MIQLGSEVEDPITGFKGIAVAAANYLTGCRTIKVQPRVGKDGKIPDGEWLDEPRLIVKAAPKSSPLAGTAMG